MNNYEEVYEKLKEFNQEHLLNFYNELNENEKEHLLNQIENIDFNLVNNLYKNINIIPDSNKKIENIPVIRKKDVDFYKYYEIGANIIKENKIAVCQMAGGQGTRLGHDGPKGTFVLENIIPKKSIFEIFADKLNETYKKFNTKIKWYIMTSNSNDYETKSFFKENNYFNYGAENITFFKQGELPLVDTNGKVVLENKGSIFMAPDGNGGIYEALRKNNILKEMEQNNVLYLGIGNVDNILLNLLDPTFIGYMIENNYELATKTVTKVSPQEKVGVVCKLDGTPGVVEYTEISDELANERNEKGELLFGEGYFGCSIFKIDVLKKITSKLNYHPAFKKNNYIDAGSGKLIEADMPNTYKFEAFIFEGFNMAKNMLAFNVNRDEEFAPIKNRVGVDSVETATLLYMKNKNG